MIEAPTISLIIKKHCAHFFIYSSIFIPNVYFKIIAAELWLCLKEIFLRNHLALFSFEFLSTTYGKLSFLGYSGYILFISKKIE